MKKVKEILYEKFDSETDPVKDMGIGKISFGDEFWERYKEPERKLYNEWKQFMDQFKGKWIKGTFNKYDKTKPGDAKYRPDRVEAEIRMIELTMNEDGILNIETSLGTYCILSEEKYTIKDQ
jgi:hypothetical protein